MLGLANLNTLNHKYPDQWFKLGLPVRVGQAPSRADAMMRNSAVSDIVASSSFHGLLSVGVRIGTSVSSMSRDR